MRMIILSHFHERVTVVLLFGVYFGICFIQSENVFDMDLVCSVLLSNTSSVVKP